MKKHAGGFILTGLIISGLGLLWLICAGIILLKNNSGTVDTASDVLFVIVVALIAALIISMTIVSLVKYRKGKPVGVSAIIPMIIASIGIGYILSVVAEWVMGLKYYIPYGCVDDFLLSLWHYLLTTGFIVQIIGYIIMLIGFMGLFLKKHGNSLSRGSASFALSGTILFFAASILSVFNEVDALVITIKNRSDMFYIVERAINVGAVVMLSVVVVCLAIRIQVKCRKGKMSVLSAVFLLDISSAGVFNILIGICDNFPSSEITFEKILNFISPLLSSGEMMKLIAYVIFVIGTAGMLAKNTGREEIEVLAKEEV